MQTPQRDRWREREAEWGWGLFREHTTENGSACVGYIMRFNWIVLHQCQEVSWCVCRGLCSNWLRAWFSLFSPPKQANTWQGKKKVSLRFQSQTIGARGTQRGSWYIKAGLKHLYPFWPCPKSAKVTQNQELCWRLSWMQTIHGSWA